MVVRYGLNLLGKNGSPHPLSGFKCGYSNGWEPSQHVFQHDIHFTSVKDLCLQIWIRQLVGLFKSIILLNFGCKSNVVEGDIVEIWLLQRMMSLAYCNMKILGCSV